MKLDNDEKKLLQSLDAGEWTPVKNIKSYKKHFEGSCKEDHAETKE